MEEIGEPATQRRKARLDLALKILRSRKRMSLGKACALLSFNLGITEKKAEEYINTLVQVDGIKKEGDLVVRRE